MFYLTASTATSAPLNPMALSTNRPPCHAASAIADAALQALQHLPRRTTTSASNTSAPQAPDTTKGVAGEPAPGSPEALAMLASLGIALPAAAGSPLGPDDQRFSPIAIGHLTHRLVEVKLLLDQLGAEQKELHDTLRLAHLAVTCAICCPREAKAVISSPVGCSCTAALVAFSGSRARRCRSWRPSSRPSRFMSRPMARRSGVWGRRSGSYGSRRGETASASYNFGPGDCWGFFVGGR